jgi:glycosyltransferase involved in cell wall biosynthesis
MTDGSSARAPESVSDSSELPGTSKPCLRVVVDGAILSRPPTGAARWVRGLSAALDRLPDMDVVLVSGPAHIRRGGRLHRIPNLVRERWWYENGINRIARRERADAMLMPSNLTARPGRIPQVVTVLDVNFLTQADTYERSFVRYATWAYRRSIRDATHATTISEFSRSEIARHLGVDPARLEVIYPGLDEVPPGMVGAVPHDGPYALYVGATERHKNVGLLLDAWRDRSPAGLALVIVGQPGRDHDMVLERAAGCRGRVIVRGRVDAEELERWYRHASVFLFPSRVEGFGYPPLEAMQRGVPVVSSTGGSLPEVLGDGALYFDPDDRLAVIGHVEGLMADETGRIELVNRGFRVAGRYTWLRTARAMSSALRQVVAETGSGADGR